MMPTKFTELARRHGLLVHQCGLAAVKTLELINKMPVEPRKLTEGTRFMSASPVPHVGVLIRNGFAALENGAYRATPQGREWLGKINAMLNQYQL